MAHEWPVPFEGGCGCKALRYRINRSPLLTHCCNCESCQRETGSAFAVNVMVESDQVTLLPSSRSDSTQSDSKDDAVVKPKLVLMPSESGKGHLIARCPACFVAVWSHYPGGGPAISFIRGGTIDKVSVDGTSVKELIRPDMFIFTKWRQPWVVYPTEAEENGKVVQEFYNVKEHWPEEAFERFAATRPKTNEWVERGMPWGEVGDVVDLR